MESFFPRIKFKTASGSVYLVDSNTITRLEGVVPPTPHQTNETKTFENILNFQLGDRPHIIWGMNKGVLETTLLSEIIEMDNYVSN